MSKNSNQRFIKIQPNNFQERVLLVGVQTNNVSRLQLEESLQELSALTDTAGAFVAGIIIQNLSKPQPKYFIGEGKVHEIREWASNNKVDLVIFDDDLSPSQQRNLEDIIGTRVIDRTALILDIFACRARTREGKIQVELAQLNYLLPRLSGKGVLMSRLGGGIGTRGPGETKLEIDRRRIRERISKLRRELEVVKKTRYLHREKRKTYHLPVVSLVGYTNSGKSTLFNYLTKANILAENKLFSTLDPTTRLVKLNRGNKFFLNDTVGFIRKLPPQLVESFKATLEEIVMSDLLINVVDVSSPLFDEHIKIVMKTLSQINAEKIPQVFAFNKIDIVQNKEYIMRVLESYGNSAIISARTGEGIDNLLTIMSKYF